MHFVIDGGRESLGVDHDSMVMCQSETVEYISLSTTTTFKVLCIKLQPMCLDIKRKRVKHQKGKIKKHTTSFGGYLGWTLSREWIIPNRPILRGNPLARIPRHYLFTYVRDETMKPKPFGKWPSLLGFLSGRIHAISTEFYEHRDCQDWSNKKNVQGGTVLDQFYLESKVHNNIS